MGKLEYSFEGYITLATHLIHALYLPKAWISVIYLYTNIGHLLLRSLKIVAAFISFVLGKSIHVIIIQ